jgi:hypothetical protein
MPAQPDSFSSEKEQELPALIKPTLGVKIALCLWMTAVFFVYLLMYGPPVFWEFLKNLGLYDLLRHLRDLILPFFQNSDYSNKIEFR